MSGLLALNCRYKFPIPRSKARFGTQYETQKKESHSEFTQTTAPYDANQKVCNFDTNQDVEHQRPVNAIAAVTATPQPPAPVVVTAPAPVAPAPAPVVKAAPVRVAAVVNSANCETPDYPSASRRLEEEGTVSLRFLVGVDGKVIQAEVEKSSGYKRLDEAARAGLSRCSFKPATVDGKPEQGWANMKYTWRLE
jgi:TonB family protein